MLLESVCSLDASALLLCCSALSVRLPSHAPHVCLHAACRHTNHARVPMGQRSSSVLRPSTSQGTCPTLRLPHKHDLAYRRPQARVAGPISGMGTECANNTVGPMPFAYSASSMLVALLLYAHATNADSLPTLSVVCHSACSTPLSSARVSLSCVHSHLVT